MQAKPIALAALLSVALAAAAVGPQKPKDTDWPVYGGNTAGDRYSPLTQINRSNVRQLKVAWTYDTHEPGGLQTNPLIIGRILYGFTPTQKVIALDAATGKLLWTFTTGTPDLQPTRGLTYWTDGSHPILFAGLLSYLYALDPATGQPIPTFGEGGRIDLRKDLGETNIAESFAAMTSPGTIYKDLIIVGFRLPETHPALRGDIRAFDVHTGKLRWAFHTIPHPGEPGYETWPPDAWKTAGSANNWTGMTLDAERGIVYAPTGSAVDDFYGADRLGNDLYADTLLALDANTGRRLWHFQGVHHDIWDRDSPPRPPSSPSAPAASRSTPSPRPPSRASSISSTAPPAVRSSPSKNAPTRRPPSPKKWPRPRNPSPRCPRRSPASYSPRTCSPPARPQLTPMP